MSRTLTRFADGLLARLVPQTHADAGACTWGRTVWRTCYCSRGLRIGQPCYYVNIGNDTWRCACFGCQAVIGTC